MMRSWLGMMSVADFFFSVFFFFSFPSLSLFLLFPKICLTSDHPPAHDAIYDSGTVPGTHSHKIESTVQQSILKTTR